jgi:NADPH:quinone reductase-like Zn-dependent oxidoreductase
LGWKQYVTFHHLHNYVDNQASASVGLYAVQIAALFGFQVATVCSPRHFPLLHSHGAKYIFDYKDPDVIQKIRKALPDIKYTFDTIGTESSSARASRAMSDSGGVLCTVRPGKEFTEKVTARTKVTSVLVFTSFLKDHQMGATLFPVSFSRMIFGLCSNPPV